MKITGDCYEAAGRLLMDIRIGGFQKNISHEDVVLVHAEVTGQGPIEGIRHGHAFVLNRKTNMVLDKSMGRDIEWPKDFYFALGKIGENKHEYTYAEMRTKVNEFKHWGPWDLSTEHEGRPPKAP